MKLTLDLINVDVVIKNIVLIKTNVNKIDRAEIHLHVKNCSIWNNYRNINEFLNQNYNAYSNSGTRYSRYKLGDKSCMRKGEELNYGNSNISVVICDRDIP